MVTAGNRRFHAAGHLAAAYELARVGEVSSASYLLKIVAHYMEQPNVDSPPQMRASLAEYIQNPEANLDNLRAFEALFVSDENTMLEESGIRLGKG